MQGEIQKDRKKEQNTNIYFPAPVTLTLHTLSEEIYEWLLLNLYFNRHPLINGKFAPD